MTYKRSNSRKSNFATEPFFPVDRAAFPVGHGAPLVEHIAPELALFEHVGSRPGGVGLVPLFPLFLPLGFTRFPRI
jgi:hypothetical protein